MSWKTALISALLVLVLGIGGATLYLLRINTIQTDGTVELSVLSTPVRIVRDEKGMPFIYADSIEDAFRAQGWVMAQDRLSQATLALYLSQGRLSELIGEAGRKTDILYRVIGLRRLGEQHAKLLSARERRFHDVWLEGFNAYINERKDEYPLGLRLLGLSPSPWTIEDMMSVHYFLLWSSSSDLRAELVSQMLIEKVGPRAASELSLLTINPDDGSEYAYAYDRAETPSLNLQLDQTWLEPGDGMFRLGSNSWVIAPEKSTSGGALMVNNPHIDTRNLPGNWYPVGLVTPEFRAVGAAGFGPGMGLGRTESIAYGVTNSYGDVIDLYIEERDPGNTEHYLEGDRSIAFDTREESLKIRDRNSEGGYREETLIVRSTRRGPVISDHGMALDDGKVISLRWAPAESMAPELGSLQLYFAKSFDEAREAIGTINAPYTYTLVSQEGDIAMIPAGRIPIRTNGDGSRPFVVRDGSDNWDGFIPDEEMPQSLNPARGWTGNGNHRYVPGDYPYYYQSYAAASWRYRRMLELLDGSEMVSPEDNWTFMQDVENLMAVRIAPIMTEALRADDETRDMAEILDGWSYQDDKDLVAPLIFQAVYAKFAQAVFEDELGDTESQRLLKVYYYWHERLARMIDQNDSDWFDDRRTGNRETRDDLFRRAALQARAMLTEQLGPDISTWTWGRLHQITFFAPGIPGKTAAKYLGGGTRPLSGSGETLNRAIHKFDAPFEATIIDSMRIVIDMADRDKMLAVTSGGVSARLFSPHLKDQNEKWFTGEKTYWWYSDKAIAENQVSELILTPSVPIGP